MSYISCREDIIDRYNETLIQPMWGLLSNPDTQMPVEVPRTIRAYLQRCQEVETDIKEHLDLLTDPKIDLAHELKKCRSQIREIQERGKEESTSLEQRYRMTIDKLELELRRERERRKKCESDLQLLLNAEKAAPNLLNPPTHEMSKPKRRGGLD